MERIQRKVDKFYRKRPIIGAHNTNLFVVEKIKEEADEVGGEIMSWMGGEPDEAMKKRLAHELADVAIYTIFMANRHNINLAQAVVEKLAINNERFPAKMFKEGDFGEIYTRRKKELGER